ncbi:hypothetical protein GW17_00034697 [Ensete ventricosum]|nr:hypothetical protein GW17_00034697 [Ensete ventricosum]
MLPSTCIYHKSKSLLQRQLSSSPDYRYDFVYDRPYHQGVASQVAGSVLRHLRYVDCGVATSLTEKSVIYRVRKVSRFRIKVSRPRFGGMRVHPAPRKRNITFRYDVNPAATAAAVLSRQKKLRRLPHIFSKVLELPFKADADVAIEENAEGFRFVAATDDLWGNVRAHAIEIYPGVMKVVVRDGGGVDLEEGLELDRWRFRLPPSTRPALATASYSGGVLVVTVPKGARPDEENGGAQEFLGGRLVIVQ